MGYCTPLSMTHCSNRLGHSFLLVAAALAVGCGSRDPAPVVAPRIDTATVVRAHLHLREQTLRRFPRASFLSPQPDADAGIPLWMAPLLVHEYSPDPMAEPRWARFGAVAVDPTGLATVDCDRPTVYWSAAEITVGTQTLEQRTFWWFYPSPALDKPIRYRGFRMTLGNGGYAVIWELLCSDTGDSRQRTFYVSKPVEQAATERFGVALAGRQHVVEPPLEEHPEVVVSRIVGDGPQPMGPIVYLDAAGAVTTLICRCEPSQADAFPHSSHYRLQRIDAPQDLYGDGMRPPNLRLPPGYASPEGLLRLPDQL